MAPFNPTEAAKEFIKQHEGPADGHMSNPAKIQGDLIRTLQRLKPDEQASFVDALQKQDVTHYHSKLDESKQREHVVTGVVCYGKEIPLNPKLESRTAQAIKTPQETGETPEQRQIRLDNAKLAEFDSKGQMDKYREGAKPQPSPSPESQH